MGPNHGAVIADLEERRAAIDQILEGYKRLAAGTAPTAAAEPAAAVRRIQGGNGRASRVAPGRASRPKPPQSADAETAKSSGRRTYDDADFDRARKVAESEGLPAAARKTGIPYGTLYTHSQQGKWKLPAKGAKKPVKKGLVCSKCFQSVTKSPTPCCSAPAREVSS